MGKIEGRIAVVTGAARGIGRSVACRLAKEGALVIIFDRSAAFDTVELIEREGGRAEAVELDITSSAQVNRTIEELLDRFGRIDILVNNAGILSTHENLLSVTDEIWDREIAVNLTGGFYCCRAALAPMIVQKYGKIINISSLAGNTGRVQTSPAYSAAKAGVLGLTRSLAKTSAQYGINVNAVCPGFMITDITKAYPKDVLNKLLSEVPYTRGGKPEDIASAVLFLASDDADYITGATLCVNGGSWMG